MDSGAVLDLPYVFVADGEQDQMAAAPDFDFSVLAGLFQSYMGICRRVTTLADMSACGTWLSNLVERTQ
jgi:hypothetical protein